METIKAGEKALKDVFCDHYVFRIPPYQRPYSWTREQASELLDDLKWASGKDNPGDRPPYFLGSIVVIKDPNRPEADVVDGQQRLTTLTILMSVLRELAPSEDDKANIDIFLRQKGNKVLGTKDIVRLTVRKRDETFFRKCIQEGQPGGVSEQPDTDARQRMIANRDYFREALGKMSEPERSHLLPFTVQRCFLVVVEASDPASAYRIFSVMNNRGLDLTATDILKSDIIGAIDGEDGRTAYNEKWEALEDGLGRQAFGDLFAHLRMIHRKQKMRGSLETEFRDYVKPREAPKKFIDEELKPSADIFERILEPDPSKPGRYRLLKGLHQIDNQDWQPPAISYMVRHFADDGAIDQFLRKLDRLAYYLFIIRADVNERITRYALLLNEIEARVALPASLELSDKEKVELRAALGGDIYNNSRTRRPILLRLDEMLSDGTAHYDHSLVTIEHVLPQHPKNGSEWEKNFPTQALRDQWVHRLANLVLLSRYKNPAASNYDFQTKKTKYFAQDGDAAFVLTNQVREESNWLVGTLEARQNKLLKRMADVWQLN